MGEKNDEKLVNQYLNGDEKSLEVLIKQYLKPIYEIIRGQSPKNAARKALSILNNKAKIKI